ncbi:MAG: hypothetical protein J0I24_03595 [Thiomonas arsenitoxydans]|uniref:Uncharacterized protein n=1 Tax=Thiomonas arsenitoxydans (strain DSM 22701 / CIP 110005 / 3As) TaxID=426114 RepID=A0A8I1MUG3_THIA3|nr:MULTISPECIES: hypothetical protein [Thiomonas]MBN8743369.1 hypothetical protein [Thiomonas arsenitoxydans]ODU98445.1 MAG: hypothetical protein ABT24_02030 [Thiomonas sp. SCN 64-16]
MSRLLRPVLVLLLVLLPLRGWAQVSMNLGDGVQTPAQTTAQAQAHEMTSNDMASMADLHSLAAEQHTSDAMPGCHVDANTPADCGSHDHQHCVICHLAVAQPPAFTLLLTDAAQHSCPSTANTAWHSAEPRSLQRPPRA